MIYEVLYFVESKDVLLAMILKPIECWLSMDLQRPFLLVPVVLMLLMTFDETGMAGEVSGSEPRRVRMVTADGGLILDDGVRICLVGLSSGLQKDGEGTSTSLKRGLEALVGDEPVVVELNSTTRHDRYGCLRARIKTADGRWLQHMMVRQGMAMVHPLSWSGDRVDDLLALEDEARSMRRGIWQSADALPKAAGELESLIGTTQIVEGRVTRISSNDRYVYLNFGADWRTDFTVRVNQDLIARDNLDVRGFDGRKLRVRGFIQESRGPLIDIINPKQIEVLP